MQIQLNLREAIYERIRDKSNETLFEVVEGSIGNDEKTLPGLGVLFELIWQHSGEDAQKQMIHTLGQHIPPSNF